MSKYKYYFKQPRSEIVKDIFNWLVISGAVCIAASSPYFILNLLNGFNNRKKYKNKEIYNAFYRLRKVGCLNIEKKNHQIYINLTEEGKRKAGMFQIDSLKITQPKRWDGKWRLVLFDISQIKKTRREIFRGKLKELGFYPFQKSVWAHPYPCDDEVQLLRDFLGLSSKEIQVVTVQKIEDDSFLREIFKL